MNSARVLPGLPPYGPQAVSFPDAFARRASEGFVVEFTPDQGPTWVGNFAQGFSAVEGVWQHPNEVDVLVIAAGTAYVVSRSGRTAAELACDIERVWAVENPTGFVFQRSSIDFLRLGSTGIVWHTRRVSWDGLAEVELGPEGLSGRAWGLDDSWVPFRINLNDGAVEGGSYEGPNDSRHLLGRIWAWLTFACGRWRQAQS